jgi:hypothetical protein
VYRLPKQHQNSLNIPKLQWEGARRRDDTANWVMRTTQTHAYTLRCPRNIIRSCSNNIPHPVSVKWHKIPCDIEIVLDTRSRIKIQICKARIVWRYQRGNQIPYIEEEHSTQWPKENKHVFTRAGTTYRSVANALTRVFCGIRVNQLSVSSVHLMPSHYHFGILYGFLALFKTSYNTTR